MKEWTMPEIETIDINETAGGGKVNPVRDHVFVSVDNGDWEGFVPSGK